MEAEMGSQEFCYDFVGSPLGDLGRGIRAS